MSYDTTLLTLPAYAQMVDATERTVQRWLAAGELPGAVKDERGRWLIPATTQRNPGTDITTTRPTTSYDMSPVERVDALPSFLRLEHAAELLGISRHAILNHREYFDVVPFGPNGAHVIPLATIRRIRG
jgi:predicted DNA-binding transcriptional regulator AlpA